jgi:hypothetical protein
MGDRNGVFYVSVRYCQRPVLRANDKGALPPSRYVGYDGYAHFADPKALQRRVSEALAKVTESGWLPGRTITRL